MFGFANNNMVEQDQLNQFTCLQEIARGVVVAGGWFRIAGRMVVNQDHGGGGNMECFLDHTADVDRGLGGRAFGDVLLPKNLVLSVQEDSDNDFLALAGETVDGSDRRWPEMIRMTGAMSFLAHTFLPSSNAALIWATFAGPRPGTFNRSCTWARSRPRRPLKSVSNVRAKSAAFCPRIPSLNVPWPTRRMMASNSASVSLSAPSASNRSRGRSFLGQAMIPFDFRIFLMLIGNSS